MKRLIANETFIWAVCLLFAVLLALLLPHPAQLAPREPLRRPAMP
jgi:hypothetical protein